MTVEEAWVITEKHIDEAKRGLRPILTMQILEAMHIRFLSEISSEKIIFRGTEKREVS